MTHHPDCDVNDINPDGIKKPCNCGTPTETPTPSWTVETIMLINKLTPDIKDKSADPDWFLLRQRFEEMERQLTAATAQLEERDLAIKGLQEDIALMQSNQDRFMEVETARLQHSVKCRELTAQLEEARRDKERLDWLAENQRVNYGLSVGGYFYKSDLRWQENRIRQAIDAAMQQKEGQ